MAIIPHLRYINLYHHCAHSVGVVHHRALLAFKICNVISHLLVLYTMDQINAITAFHRLYVCCTFRLVKLLFLLLFLLIQEKQQQYRIQLNVMNLPILVHYINKHIYLTTDMKNGAFLHVRAVKTAIILRFFAFSFNGS